METLAAITHYCQYQERCHKEVRNKLYELGCTTPEVEEHIASLIEAGLLNEERYARAYTRGKFRMLHWGRIKIMYELKQKQIAPYCIKKGMLEIEEEEYINTLRHLASQKIKQYKSKTPAAKKAGLYAYLIQKGYERNLVEIVAKEVLEK